MKFINQFCHVLSVLRPESQLLSLALKSRMRLLVDLVATVSHTSVFLEKSKRIAKMCVEEKIDPSEWGYVGNAMLDICLERMDLNGCNKQKEVTAAWSRLFSRFLRYLIPTVLALNHRLKPGSLKSTTAQSAFEKKFAHLNLNITLDKMSTSGRIVHQPNRSYFSLRPMQSHRSSPQSSPQNSISVNSHSMHSLLDALHLDALASVPQSTKAVCNAVITRVRHHSTVVPRDDLSAGNTTTTSSIVTDSYSCDGAKTPPSVNGNRKMYGTNHNSSSTLNTTTENHSDRRGSNSTKSGTSDTNAHGGAEEGVQLESGGHILSHSIWAESDGFNETSPSPTHAQHALLRLSSRAHDFRSKKSEQVVLSGLGEGEPAE
ncbi:hypothetical protein B484DRAFT_407282 [Ochromonadaceae sp. CCMP2298]|nr:hypothetical protein B484DRAFT_407282 [Ochromonadaceae sp. CCMP2298]